MFYSGIAEAEKVRIAMDPVASELGFSELGVSIASSAVRISLIDVCALFLDEGCRRSVSETGRIELTDCTDCAGDSGSSAVDTFHELDFSLKLAGLVFSVPNRCEGSTLGYFGDVLTAKSK